MTEPGLSVLGTTMSSCYTMDRSGDLTSPDGLKDLGCENFLHGCEKTRRSASRTGPQSSGYHNSQRSEMTRKSNEVVRGKREDTISRSLVAEITHKRRFHRKGRSENLTFRTFVVIPSKVLEPLRSSQSFTNL